MDGATAWKERQIRRHRDSGTGGESGKCRDTARKTKKLAGAGSDSSCGRQGSEASRGQPAAAKNTLGTHSCIRQTDR